MENNLVQYKWVFMGTPQIAVDFLGCLKENFSATPDLIVTNPDQPTGRKQTVTPSPVSQFAQQHSTPCLKPNSPDEITAELSQYDFVCVLAYGSLLSTDVLNAPQHGVVNIHPSLLPQYRGPSPITTAILDDSKHTGVTLMKLVPHMDAGPVIAQSPVDITEWSKWDIHEQKMAQIGARLFHDYMDDYVQGKLFPEEQNYEQATYCPKYSKQDMEINLQDSPYLQYRTYCAFPRPFFISPSLKRFVVEEASWVDNQFVIETVTPAGKPKRDFNPTDLL